MKTHFPFMEICVFQKMHLDRTFLIISKRHCTSSPKCPFRIQQLSKNFLPEKKNWKHKYTPRDFRRKQIIKALEIDYQTLRRFLYTHFLCNVFYRSRQLLNICSLKLSLWLIAFSSMWMSNLQFDLFWMSHKSSMK